MMSDPKNDQSLLSLIKENAPEAPHPPKNEEACIQAWIENMEKPWWKRSIEWLNLRPWVYAFGAAALIAAVIIPQKAGIFGDPKQVALQDQQLETYLQNTLAAVYRTESIDLNGWGDLLESANEP